MQPSNAPPENEKVPFLGSWGRIYALILFYLFLVIVALSVFAASFRI